MVVGAVTGLYADTYEDVLDDLEAYKQLVATMVGDGVTPDDVVIQLTGTDPVVINYFVDIASPDLEDALDKLEEQSLTDIQALMDEIPDLAGVEVVSNTVDRDASQPGATLPPTPLPTNTPTRAPSASAF